MSSFRIDPRQINDLADRLATITPERLGRGAVAAANEVLTRFTDTSVDRITDRVALDAGYVRSKMTTELATSAADPTATLTVAGPGRPSGNGLTILGRYPYGTVQSGTSRRTAGVGIEVRRGAPKFMDKAFTIRLKYGNGTGIFRRENGKLVHQYGPAPYSLTRQQITYHEQELRDDLERTTAARIADEIQL